MKAAVCLFLFAVWAAEVVSAGPAPVVLRVFAEKSVLDPEVYPLGWAKDGTRLALLVAQPHEAADERDWMVSVTDLVSDEVVFTKTFSFVPQGEGVDAFWTAHGAEIEAICHDQGVTRSTVELRPFPALPDQQRRNETYEVSAEATREQQPDFGYRGISRLKISLTKDGSATKVILDKSWPKYYPLAAGVLGYIPNPDATRIAVVTGLIERGYEGAPHIRRLLVTGARIGSKF